MLLLLAFLIVVWWLFWRTTPPRPPVATPPVQPTAAPEAPTPPAPMTMVTQVALEAEPADDVPIMVEMPIMAGAPAGLMVMPAPAAAEKPAPVPAAEPPVAPVVEAPPVVEEPAPVEDPVLHANALPTATADETPDDFTLIEGIGPKINELLHKAAITTFPQLSAASVEQLRAILDAARLRVADPTTWPEQAALAAAQQWDELKALQGQLKGGKRVG